MLGNLWSGRVQHCDRMRVSKGRHKCLLSPVWVNWGASSQWALGRAEDSSPVRGSDGREGGGDGRGRRRQGEEGEGEGGGGRRLTQGSES